MIGNESIDAGIGHLGIESRLLTMATPGALAHDSSQHPAIVVLAD